MLDQPYDDFYEAYGYRPTIMLVSFLLYHRYEGTLLAMTRFVDGEGAETATKWLGFKGARVYGSPMLRGKEVICA